MLQLFPTSLIRLLATKFQVSSLGQEDDIPIRVFQHHELARDRFASVHVCQSGLIKVVGPKSASATAQR